jgi:hypothetical protein
MNEYRCIIAIAEFTVMTGKSSFKDPYTNQTKQPIKLTIRMSLISLNRKDPIVMSVAIMPIVEIIMFIDFYI